ncbi:hypothetical protein C4588_05825 [Candidatus Parcubacteria bacterium]|nr:MAG: hypothetical protein C4588_05825 [Candidatus Parcubacteria bacterium]
MLSTDQLKKENSKVYVYTDESGNPLYCKVRKDGEKTFLQYTAVSPDYWQTGVNCKQTLYNLPGVVEAKKKGRYIFFCEGEKDVETLRKLGFYATTSGSTSSWKPEFAEYFEGVVAVYILPDNDGPGKTFAGKVAEDIAKTKTPVKIINLPGLEEKQDITDWLDCGGTIEELKKLVKDTKWYEKKEKTSLLDYVLKPGDLNMPEKWLIDGILAPETITTIYSKSGGGKSYFTLLTACYLLESDKIDSIIYLDNDNSKRALKNRQIEEIQEKFKNNFFYVPSFKIDKELFEILDKELADKKFGKSLIIVDSIRNFLNGKNPNDDRDSIAFMDTMKLWRSYGNTVILLHHTRKDGIVKNNTSFIDYADAAFGLFTTKEKDKNRLFFEFMNTKDRIGTLEEFSGFLNYDINSLEIAENLVNPDDYEFTNIVIDFLLEGVKTQGEIKKHLRESGYNTTDYNQRMLIKYTGTLWAYERGEKNSKNYSLLPDKLPTRIFKYHLNLKNEISGYQDNSRESTISERITEGYQDNSRESTVSIVESEKIVMDTVLSCYPEFKSEENGINTEISSYPQFTVENAYDLNSTDKNMTTNIAAVTVSSDDAHLVYLTEEELVELPKENLVEIMNGLSEEIKRTEEQESDLRYQQKKDYVSFIGKLVNKRDLQQKERELKALIAFAGEEHKFGLIKKLREVEERLMTVDV